MHLAWSRLIFIVAHQGQWLLIASPSDTLQLANALLMHASVCYPIDHELAPRMAC